MSVLAGTQEHLQCINALARVPGIEPIEIGGQKNVCIGFKFSVEWAGLPYRTTDDGYVLTVPDSKQYLALDAEQLATLQSTGQVATPVPAYSIPSGWYLAQFSLWAVLAAIIAGVGFRFYLRRRVARRRHSGAITTSGPALAKAKDRELAAKLQSLLDGDEVISHQAYAHDRDPSTISDSLAGREFFVALTNRRIVWIESKIGVLGMGKGAQTFGAIDRSTISGIAPHKNTLEIMRDGEPPMLLHIPLAGHRYSFENQSAFLADLPRIVGV